MEAAYFSLWKTVLHSKNLDQGDNRQLQAKQIAPPAALLPTQKGTYRAVGIK